MNTETSGKETKVQRILAPNGLEIVASADLVPGNALLHGGSRGADGSLDIDWDGETKMCWDGQFTEELDGRRVFIDSAGNQWTEEELRLESEPEVPPSPRRG